MLKQEDRNVNGMFQQGMEHLSMHGEESESRAGRVVVMPFPVVSVYEQPTERVLFSPERDANPFFHLAEGLWMLAGRDDAAFLDHYVSDFGERFAEDTGRIHGAYGVRWRRGWVDQLDAVVAKLRANPDDRQCVIQMWDASQVSGDLTGNWRDRPCNTHAYLRVRTQEPEEKDAAGGAEPYRVLDLTVCCRSNDLIWGAHGANAVHFSMLLEYLAGRIGVSVGRMYQFSNNYHGYVTALDKIGDPAHLEVHDYYDDGTVYALAIGEDWSQWDADLFKWVEWHRELWEHGPDTTRPRAYVNAWFEGTAQRAATVNWLRRNKRAAEARQMVEHVTAPDWRMAMIEWLERRL